ncbi:hypothetical protein E2C01_075821 [Portunus trituberculatus]|uniref:Uncharacterized protein n=1 Tax=Portunus trituberculatus TaxID=210409 RepID=A0A5B7ILI5_PORTR|nr:hypothetical protein [Portunus trituberculatus]
MEGVVTRSRDALNYSFWCLGAMHLLAAHNLPAPLLDLEKQLFKAIYMALNDACKDATHVIANLRAWRREAYLGHLSQVKKGILHRSSIFTPLLFDEDRLQEALQSSKSNADRMLHEAALRALARPRPAPGTTLVECGLQPSTSTAVRPSAAAACRPSFAACARGSRGGWFGALTLLVLACKEGDGRASPFGSDALPLQGAVAGCLACRWEEWLKIGAETWILDILREGYRIPFSALPPLTTHFKEPRGYAPGSLKDKHFGWRYSN